jgi:hypothetical protein
VVREKLVQLQAFEQSLARFVDNCNTTCCGGTAENCTLYDDIARDGAAK